MKAIFKKELRSYFTSPVGYVFMAIYFLFASFMFSFLLMHGISDIQSIYATMTLSFFLIPIITMKTIAEEKRAKTDQLLLTAPISVYDIVAGKVLAAFVMYAIPTLATVIFAVIFEIFGSVSWSIVFSSYIGLLLIGLIYVCAGVFISSITENQIIAAIVSIAFVLFASAYDSFIVPSFTNETVFSILNWFSINMRFNDFYYGIISFETVVYYLSLIVLFVILTISGIEKRRFQK